MTKIEWTEKTWNPIVGCSVTTPGCTNCYAMRMAWRLANNPTTPQYHGLVKKVNGQPVWTGGVALAELVLTAPIRRQKPTKYFVNSMGDLFHEDVPDGWIDRVFAAMALCPQHTFQVLTKRARRMREYCSDGERRKASARIAHCMAATGQFEIKHTVSLLWPLSHVWLGVSVEDQTRADERIPDLLGTPAAVRFISAEPLLGPLQLWKLPTVRNPRDPGFAPKLDWVIVGGESGPNTRPMHPDWARSVRDQCADADVPFFFKQWGCGDKSRMLDGREWNEVPQ